MSSDPSQIANRKSQITLGVVMIVKNEAGCLAQCLNAVRPIADEILIGDTGSTDNTPAIAATAGARVIHIPWNNDFAQARNQVLDAAQSDWLLHLDADEIIDPHAAARIRALIDNDGEDADAIELILANYCNDPHAWRWRPAPPGDPCAQGYAGYIAAPLLRLFRNHRGYQYREPVHENITESVIEKGGRIRTQDIIIHHYGFNPPGPRAQAKNQLYLQIARAKAAQRPNDPKTWHDLAELLIGASDPNAAELACQKALELDPLHLGAATALASLYLNRGAFDDARTLLERLENAGFDAPHIPTALAAIDERQGRLQQALARLEKTIAAHPQTLMARLVLARTFDRLGSPTAARQQLEAALEIAPSLTETQNRLHAHQLRLQAERAFEENRIQPALKALVEALRQDPEDPFIHYALGRIMESLGDTTRARACYHRARQLAPSIQDPQP